jgi:hypothetical protein
MRSFWRWFLTLSLEGSQNGSFRPIGGPIRGPILGFEGSGFLGYLISEVSTHPYSLYVSPLSSSPLYIRDIRTCSDLEDVGYMIPLVHRCAGPDIMICGLPDRGS